MMRLEDLLTRESKKGGFKVESFLYRRKDNGNVNAYWLTPRTSKGSVLFVHGFGNDSLYPQLCLFLKLLSRDYSVFSFDLDGHGMKSSTILNPSCLLSALEDAQDQLRNLDGKPIHLVGHSLGALLAFQHCVRMQSPFQSLSLISYPHTIHMDPWTFIQELTLSLGRPSFLEKAYIMGSGIIPAVGSFRRSQYPLRSPPGLTRDKIFQELGKLTDSSLVAPTLPTLFCYGDQDRITPLPPPGDFLTRSSQELFVAKGETHLTTILSRQTEDRICAWVSNWRANDSLCF